MSRAVTLSKEELATMLIITRRQGEKVMVGEDIVVHVMEIVGNSVRVGIEAPRSVPVYREEIWNAVREENRAAADASPADLPTTPHE
jgi:carbon storage regulator